MSARILKTVYLFFIMWFWPSVKYIKEASFRYLVVDATLPLSDISIGGNHVIQSSSSSSSISTSRRFDCDVCGYEYEGSKIATKWEDLSPDEFECPVCRAPKSMFHDVTSSSSRSSQESVDKHFMKRALKLASYARGHTRPNPVVGCVIVDPISDTVVGEGYHIKAGMDHAEVMVKKRII